MPELAVKIREMDLRRCLLACWYNSHDGRKLPSLNQKIPNSPSSSGPGKASGIYCRLAWPELELFARLGLIINYSRAFEIFHK